MLMFPLCACSILYGRTHLPHKHVVVSFDDGPNNITTPKLLDTLLKYNIKATFFMVGANIDNTELMQRMVREGHIAGSHTFGHAHMTRVSFEEMKEQIIHTEERFQKHIGDRPWFFRAPYGELNNQVTSFLKGRHYEIIGWDDDTFDWQKSTPEQVVQAAVNLLQKHETGAIMLMHEYVWTTEAQKTLLPKIESLGWQFSNPIDILTESQLDSLKKNSCTPNVCESYRFTRPWCCPALESVHTTGSVVKKLLKTQRPVITKQTLLKTQRPVAQEIQRAWKQQKQEIYSQIDSMENKLRRNIQEHVIEQLDKHSDKWKIKMAFAVGLWTAILCCTIVLLCVKLYKRKKKNR